MGDTQLKTIHVNSNALAHTGRLAVRSVIVAQTAGVRVELRDGLDGSGQLLAVIEQAARGSFERPFKPDDLPFLVGVHVTITGGPADVFIEAK